MRTHRRRVRQTLVSCVCVAAAVGCASQVRRFPLSPPRWEDADRHHVSETPSEYYSGLIADGLDKSFLRPLARAPYLPLPERARNVNALDEVPNSSWFLNRLGMHPISPERVAKAACGDDPPLDPSQPWTVVAAKPNGANPGFFIEAETGRYLLKFDGVIQPQRATSADVIGSKIYWAAGYHAPCNEIVYFRRENLKIAPDAEAEDAFGNDRPITQEDIDKVLAAAYRTKDGLLRASSSKFLPGRPLGPFKYDGTRGDDPNDHIPHEHRRELRANRLLSAWLNHHDAREQNTLDVWIEEGKRSYIRHYMIDWGDCLGGRGVVPEMTRRTGHSYVIDYEHAVVDFATLGIFPRPWHGSSPNQEAEIFGYYSTRDFAPSEWKTDYPNAAFVETRYDDQLWMARIIARFSDAHLRAIVREARLSNKRAEAYLIRAMKGRRNQIVREYFTHYAPLDRFRVVRRTPGDLTQSLCFEDIATRYRVVDPRRTIYKIRFYAGEELDRELGWLQFQPDLDHPHRSCVQLPLGDIRPAQLAPSGAPAAHPLRYGVMKIWIHQRPGERPTSAIHLHFYDLGPEKGYRLVGIERPDRPVTPDVY